MAEHENFLEEIPENNQTNKQTKHFYFWKGFNRKLTGRRYF